MSHHKTTATTTKKTNKKNPQHYIVSNMCVAKTPTYKYMMQVHVKPSLLVNFKYIAAPNGTIILDQHLRKWPFHHWSVWMRNTCLVVRLCKCQLDSLPPQLMLLAVQSNSSGISAVKCVPISEWRTAALESHLDSGCRQTAAVATVLISFVPAWRELVLKATKHRSCKGYGIF